MGFNLFEKYRKSPSGAPAQEKQSEATAAPREADNDNPDKEKARQELLARRTQLEEQIEIGGASTREDREMLEDIDNRLRLLDQAA